MTGGVISGGLIGVALGMRHAFEPDHLAAVSNMVAARPRAGAAAWVGACWGFGHSIALFVVGGALLLLRLELPPWLADLFELAVAFMLMGLGTRGLVRAFRAGKQGSAARAPHAHAFTAPHVHAGPADHLHLGRWTLARGPLMIGLVHGLAGSGALTAVVVSTIPGRGEGLLYLLLFGLGSVAGMALVTGLSSLPMRRVADDARIMARVVGVAGLLSLVVGILWAAPLLARFAALV
jgi:hypothetical protein